MAAGTTALLLGASAALTAVGTGVSVIGQIGETNARKRAEAARKKQQDLIAQRQRRSAIRQSILARSQAEFNAANQGAQFGSALPGAFGQISGETGRQLGSINQNQTLGNEIFEANQAYFDASKVTSAGAGLSRLADVAGNLGTSGTGQRIVDYFTG